MSFAREVLDRPVAAIFAEIAARHPDKIAVNDGAASLRYGELLELAASIAQRIVEVVPPHAPVGIALSNDRRFPAAMLACLAAGRPYVPLDLSFPFHRNAAIARHAGVAAFIAESASIAEALAPGSPTIEPRGRATSFPAASPEDIAYILYTSGTTGQPKGVYQNQRNLMHDVMQYIDSASITPEDQMTLIYSPCVNGAIRDIYGTLLSGATLHIADLRRQGFGRMRQILSSGAVSILHAMPPVLRAFLRAVPPHEVYPSVRLAYLAGDRLFREDVERCWQRLPSLAKIYTGIGSTENATIYRQWFLDRHAEFEGDLVPVGYPVEDRASFLLGADGEPVPRGETGEIVVSSRFMALGYWNDAALTAAAFRTSPGDPQARLFRTGDLGREAPDGLLYFVGRSDRQIKIRGYRVELAAVETALRACTGVADAAVVTRSLPDRREMVGFVVLQGSASKESVVAEIETRVPPYMVPGIRVLRDMPVLANFKPDLSALDRLAAENLVQNQPPEVASAWCAATRTAGVRNGTSWKESGGDSLQMLELLLRLERTLGRRIPTSLLCDEMTPESLARDLASLGSGSHSGTTPELPLLALAPGLSGASLHLITLARNLTESARVEVLDYAVTDAVACGSRAFTQLCGQLRDQLLTASGDASIGLLGYSFGARVVLELARLLGSERVRSLWIIDASPEGVSWKRSARKPLDRRHLWSRIRRKLLREWMNRLAAAGRFPVIRTSCRVAQSLRCGPEAQELAARAVRLASSPTQPASRYPGRLTLFRTEDPDLIWDQLPDDLGWSRHCESVEVIRIPGVTHEQILSAPRLASSICERLRCNSGTAIRV